MKKLYVVWDVVAKAIASAVLVYAGDPAAIRGFTDALADPQGPYAKHAADFELWCIAEVVELLESPKVLLEPLHAQQMPPGQATAYPVKVLTGSQFVAMQEPRIVKEA